MNYFTYLPVDKVHCPINGIDDPSGVACELSDLSVSGGGGFLFNELVVWELLPEKQVDLFCVEYYAHKGPKSPNNHVQYCRTKNNQ